MQFFQSNFWKRSVTVSSINVTQWMCFLLRRNSFSSIHKAMAQNLCRALLVYSKVKREEARAEDCLHTIIPCLPFQWPGAIDTWCRGKWYVRSFLLETLVPALQFATECLPSLLTLSPTFLMVRKDKLKWELSNKSLPKLCVNSAFENGLYLTWLTRLVVKIIMGVVGSPTSPGVNEQKVRKGTALSLFNFII